MSNWILGPTDAAGSPDAGGKARALARAERAGLPVPQWFVLSASAFHDSRDGSLSPAIARAVADALEHIAPDGQLVAVRSSAGDEDGAEHSFAGQFESFLNVSPRDVPDKVRAVWQSAFTDRLVAYR